MPIKLPKGFTRRKSSGNALDEDAEVPPQQSSFKVLERPERDGASKSFDGPRQLKRLSQGRPLSSPGRELGMDPFEGSRFGANNRYARSTGRDGEAELMAGRGSGGTNSTGGLYNSSSSSARFSSSSTLPSSADSHEHYGSQQANPQDHSAQAHPQPAFSLRAAGRAFSSGIKGTKSDSPTALSRPEAAYDGGNRRRSPVRERAMTASTASTATPPKFLDSDFNLGSSESDDFENMFSSFDRRTSQVSSERTQTAAPTSASPVSILNPISSCPFLLRIVLICVGATSFIICYESSAVPTADEVHSNTLPNKCRLFSRDGELSLLPWWPR